VARRHPETTQAGCCGPPRGSGRVGERADAVAGRRAAASRDTTRRVSPRRDGDNPSSEQSASEQSDVEAPSVAADSSRPDLSVPDSARGGRIGLFISTAVTVTAWRLACTTRARDRGRAVLAGQGSMSEERDRTARDRRRRATVQRPSSPLDRVFRHDGKLLCDDQAALEALRLLRQPLPANLAIWVKRHASSGVSPRPDTKSRTCPGWVVRNDCFEKMGLRHLRVPSSLPAA